MKTERKNDKTKYLANEINNERAKDKTT